jgi:prepilin-type N-terminal cleavage/methylation domain-containing protein/prepilin-type processing-associated H-X9-DG protein
MIVRDNRNSLRGFSLVELLVVIGILGILIAVLSPALSSAILHARTAKCSSNLRSIGAAMITFAGDNNGNLPESGGTIYHSGTSYGSTYIDQYTGQASWTEQLEPYVGASTATSVNPIFQCPDWGNVINASTGKTFSSSANPSQYYSYFNGAHAAASGNNNYAAVSLLKIKAPSAQIIAGDIAYNSSFALHDADPDDYGANNPPFGGSSILIHGGSVNLVFADGHVENARTYDSTKMTTHYAGIVNETYIQYP